MKFLTPLVLLIFSFSLTAQTKIYEDNKYVVFNLKYATDTTTVDGINWQKEKLVSEFTLKGEKSVKYSIAVENDSTAMLSRYNNGKWLLQEKIKMSDWTLRRVENKAIISGFKITDFNKDGNEDLICWTHTNINGNEWVLVYLNDVKNQKLVKLWNDAEETDIWDRPEYDEATGFISIQRDGSAYGTSDESIFLLDGFSASPVSKHYQDRSEETIIDYYYVGDNDKWELYQTIIDKTRNIEFLLPGKAKSFEGIDWKKEKLNREFVLDGRNPLKFRIALLNDTKALLEQFSNSQWTVKDSLGWFESETSYTAEESFTNSFIITDFNRDGNEDLLCWHLTNVNGNQWMTVYLNDPDSGTLVKLKNTAEEQEFEWVAPEFDKLTDTITCTTASGVYGISYISTYRLDRLQAIPLSKTVYDYSDVGTDPEHKGIKRTFTGENGKWKLIAEEKLKPELNDN